MAPTVAAVRNACAAGQAPPCKRVRLDGPGAPAAAAGGCLTSLAPNATCPITLKPVLELTDPVKDATGVVYERAAVTWFLRSLPARKRGRGITVLGSTHEVSLAELVPAGEVVQAQKLAAQKKQLAAQAQQRAAQSQQAQQQAGLAQRQAQQQAGQAQRQAQQQGQQRQTTCHVVDLTGESPRSVLACKGAARRSLAQGAMPAVAAPAGHSRQGGSTGSTDAGITSQAAGRAAPASTGRHCGGGAASIKAAQPAKQHAPTAVEQPAVAPVRAPTPAPAPAPAAAAAEAAPAAVVRAPPKVPSPMPDMGKVRCMRLTVHFGQR